MRKLLRILTGSCPKLLFICSQNRLRSATADTHFGYRDDFRVRSAGTDADARTVVDARLIRWADVIFVMEPHHLETLRDRFPEALAGKEVEVFDIPDDYDYMQRELVELLEQKLADYLERRP